MFEKSYLGKFKFLRINKEIEGLVYKTFVKMFGSGMAVQRGKYSNLAAKISWSYKLHKLELDFSKAKDLIFSSSYATLKL